MALQPIPTRAAGPQTNLTFQGQPQTPQFTVPAGTPAVPIGTGAFGPPARPMLSAPTSSTFPAPAAPTASPFGTFTGTAPTATPFGPFTGTAPTATPFGEFTAPDPTKVADSPYFQFRLSQGLKGIERGAAARGTLLTGGLQNRLQEFGQGLASEEAAKDYQRALATYETNRGTNAQNFGQTRDVFGAELAGYGANQNTAGMNADNARDAYRDTIEGYTTNRDTAEQNFSNERQAFNDALTAREATMADTARQTEIDNANRLAQYQDQMDAYARQQAATAAPAAAVAARKRGGFYRGR